MSWPILKNLSRLYLRLTKESSHSFDLLKLETELQFSMAYLMNITSGIVGALSSLKTAVSLLESIANAPLEVQQVASHLHAAEQLVRSLKSCLNVSRRSQEFHRVWDPPTETVLKNILMTITLLNEKLQGSGSHTSARPKFSLWRRISWSLTREDVVILHKQLQGYLQMLSIVQNGFMQ
jgi:hypothetical protein